MKTVKIDHVRCNEVDATTIVFAPDDWDDAIIRERVHLARNAYDEFRVEWDKTNGQPRFGTTNVQQDDPDEMTVGQIRERARLHNEQRKEYDRLAGLERHGFLEFLRQQGFTPLWELGNDVKVKVDWGHQHGVTLDYSTTLSTVGGEERGEDGWL